MRRTILTAISPPACALAILSILWALGTACRPSSSSAPTLQSAVLGVLQAAAPEVRAMSDSAIAAVGSTSLAASGEVGLVLELLTSAAAEYVQLAGAGWTERAIPVLRAVLRAYERLRELGVPLPAVPAIVRELLAPCDTLPAPGEGDRDGGRAGGGGAPRTSPARGWHPGIPPGAVAFSAPA